MIIIIFKEDLFQERMECKQAQKQKNNELRGTDDKYNSS